MVLAIVGIALIGVSAVKAVSYSKERDILKQDIKNAKEVLDKNKKKGGVS